MSADDLEPVDSLERHMEPLDEWRALPDHERLALVELVNRVLDKGVVVTGEVTISIGGVDLLFLGLQLVLSSVQSLVDAEHVRSHRLTAPDRERM
ncbi:MAG TPA: gas vesicle protein [Longimicrobiales bacterium]